MDGAKESTSCRIRVIARFRPLTDNEVTNDAAALAATSVLHTHTTGGAGNTHAHTHGHGGVGGAGAGGAGGSARPRCGLALHPKDHAVQMGKGGTTFSFDAVLCVGGSGVAVAWRGVAWRGVAGVVWLPVCGAV